MAQRDEMESGRRGWGRGGGERMSSERRPGWARLRNESDDRGYGDDYTSELEGRRSTAGDMEHGRTRTREYDDNPGSRSWEDYERRGGYDRGGEQYFGEPYGGGQLGGGQHRGQAGGQRGGFRGQYGGQSGRWQEESGAGRGAWSGSEWNRDIFRDVDYPGDSGERQGRRGGMAGRGRYAGVGPQGYRRSDVRVQEDVCDALTQDDEIDASRITVKVEHGEVTLEGTVPERDMKRAAEDCVEDVAGILQVHNRLRVERDGQRGESATSIGDGGRAASSAGSRSTESAGTTASSSTRS